MPIDYRKYPPGWKKVIRPRILAREGHCCKFCGLANHTLGWWVPSGAFYTLDQVAGGYIPPADELALDEKMARKPTPTKVELTVAHLDSQLVNHDDGNLAALCQRCHLNLDRKATAAQRKQTRRYSRRKQQLHLPFLGLPTQLHLPPTTLPLRARPASTHRPQRRRLAA